MKLLSETFGVTDGEETSLVRKILIIGLSRKIFFLVAWKQHEKVFM